MLDFRVGNGRQVPVFREVLANETIGVLVQATFPGGIRMREVDLGLKVMRHAFMVAELAPIVIGDRMHPVLVRGERLCDGVTDRLGGLMEETACMTVYNDLRSTKVTRAPRWRLPITVSPSQSPKRRRASTTAGRSSIETRLGLIPSRQHNSAIEYPPASHLKRCESFL